MRLFVSKRCQQFKKKINQNKGEKNLISQRLIRVSTSSRMLQQNYRAIFFHSISFSFNSKNVSLPTFFFTRFFSSVLKKIHDTFNKRGKCKFNFNVKLANCWINIANKLRQQEWWMLEIKVCAHGFNNSWRIHDGELARVC